MTNLQVLYRVIELILWIVMDVITEVSVMLCQACYCKELLLSLESNVKTPWLLEPCFDSMLNKINILLR